MSDIPQNHDDARRDAAGRWLPGVSGNPGGKEPGIHFRTMVRERVKKLGRTPTEAMEDVFDALFERATKGDVAACKILIERMCEDEAIQVDVRTSGHSMTDEQLVAAVQAAFEAAKRRKESGTKPVEGDV